MKIESPIITYPSGVVLPVILSLVTAATSWAEAVESGNNVKCWV